jgi:hypothetical protein
MMKNRSLTPCAFRQRARISLPVSSALSFPPYLDSDRNEYHGRMNRGSVARKLPLRRVEAMPIDRLAYAQEANETIQKLVPIGGATKPGTLEGFLGAVTNAFIPLLTIAIHQTGVAQINYPPSLTDPQLEALVGPTTRAC